MKNVCALLLIAVVAFGCKGGSTANRENGPKGGINGITDPVERNYEDFERVIGKRICGALRAKRTEFGKLDSSVAHQFRMSGELKKCGGVAFTTGLFTVDVKSVSTDYQYIALTSRPEYLKDVVTDTTGVIKTICDNLSVTDTVWNTEPYDNSRYGVNFLIKDGYDTYEIVKKTNGNIVSTEGVQIITTSSQAKDKHYGVEKERIINSLCPGNTTKREFSFIKQTLIEAVTGF